MKPQNFNRRNFLRAGAAGVVALGAAKVAEAGGGEAENNELIKTSDSMQDVTDHGALGGLTDDDHAQYLNNQRGDARYYRKLLADDQLAQKVNITDENQPNGYVGLDADGKINLTQVGDFTSPQNGQALVLRNGAIINVSETYRRLDTEFGVVADGSTNNAPAIQTAMNAVRDSEGGTLVFPNGVTRIAGNSAIDSNLKAGAIKLIGAGNSVIQIAPGTDTAFSFANNPSLTVEGLIFTGVHGTGAYDFTQAVFLTAWVEQVTFRDCQFLGLSVNAPYGEPYNGYAPNKHHGIIVASEGDLLIERCIFGGCATNQCPNVGVDSWNSLVVRDSQFVDYGYHKGDTLTKTGYTTNTWWVRAINSKPNLISARIKNKVTVERTTFDEGVWVPLMVYGAQWVEINNLVSNSSLGGSIVLINVKAAKIRDSFVGYHELNTENAVGVAVYSCDLIEVENFTTSGNVKYIVLDGRTKKAYFKNCQLQGGALAVNGVVNNAGAVVQIVN